MSDQNGITQINLAEASNHASINSKRGHTGESIQVDTWTISELLSNLELIPDDINVIRMDIEGHEEAFILDEFADLVTKTSGPLLVNLELHPRYIDEAKIHEIIAFLKSEFELVEGFYHTVWGYPVRRFDEWEMIIEEELPWTELVLVKR